MIYTVGKLASNKHPNPDFLAKEINGERRPMSKMEILGRPLYLLSDYSLYRANIDAFMYATSIQEKVFCNVTGFPFSWSEDHLIRFPRPHVYAKFNQKSFNEESLDMFKTEYGMIVSAISGGAMEVVFTRPDKTIISQVVQHAKDLNPRAVNFNNKQAVSIFGFMGFLGTLELVSAFLATVLSLVYFLRRELMITQNCYPAFHDLNVDPAQPTIREIIITSRTEDDGQEVHEEAFEENGAPMVLDTNFNPPEGEGSNMYYGYATGHVIARPSPLTTRNCGPVGLVPALPGVLFPYFHDLIEPDPTYAGPLLLSLFGRLFGEESAERDEFSSSFLAGCRAWAGTDAGMAMTHVVKMIHLALQTQTLLYLIVENTTYKGATLLGGGFEVIAKGAVESPISNTALLAELATLSSHPAVLQEIADMLSKTKLHVPTAEGRTTEEIGPGAIDTPRKLVKEARFRKLGKINRNKIESLARGTQYVQSFWPQDKEHIVKGLALSRAGVFEDGDPMYFYDDFLDFADEDRRIKSMLALFGPRPFSFQNGQGTTYRIAHPTVVDSNLVENTQTKEIPMSVIVSMPKMFSKAVSDFKRTVEDKTIVVSTSRKSNAKGFKFVGPAAREIYNAVKDAVYYGATEEDDVVPSGKKRKATEASSTGLFMGFGTAALSLSGVGPSKKAKKNKRKEAEIEEVDEEMEEA